MNGTIKCSICCAPYKWRSHTDQDQSACPKCVAEAEKALRADESAETSGSLTMLRTALCAYRSALRSGERESDKLRALGDAALLPPPAVRPSR